MPIYMKNADVQGEVTADGHTNEIEVMSFQLGVGLGVSSPTGGGGKRTASQSSWSEVVVTKALDNASGIIMDKISAGTSIGKVEFFFTRASGKAKTGVDLYLTITLEDVIFSGWSMSSGGDIPSESVSLNYGKIKYSYMKSDAKGGLTQGSIAGWDLETNKAYA